MARHENFWGYKNKLKYKYERVEEPVTTYTMSKEELEKYLKVKRIEKLIIKYIK